jgi:hypothetical protein
MQTVAPPPPTPLPAPVSGQAATAVSPNPTAALSGLPKGSILSAQVINQLPQGSVRIQSSQGTFDIRTALILAVGAKIDLQLLRTGNQAQFLIRAIDGNAVASGRLGRPSASPGSELAKPPAGPSVGTIADGGTRATAAGEMVGSPASNRTGLAEPGSTAVKLIAGTMVRARLLGQAIMLEPAAEITRPSIGNSQNILHRPVSGRLNSKTDAAAPKSIPGAERQHRPARQANAGAPQNSLAGHKPGTIVNAKVLAISKPGAPVHSISPGASRTGISGTVVESDMAGSLLVRTPGGALSLIGAEPLPAGTKLMLDIKFAASSGKPAAPQIISTAFAASRGWPSLEQAMNQLRLTAPDLAQSFNHGRLPQANSQLAANILVYLSAMRGNDMRDWLGEMMRNLEQTQPELAGRVREDFVQVARIFNDGPQSDWRTLIIPFMNGDNLEPVHMHMRGRSSGTDGEDMEDASRFLVDIKLSRLGRIQMDGLVKSKGKKFDLIIRTENPLPTQLRTGISHIFYQFSELGGIAGALAFKTVVHFIEVPISFPDGPPRPGLIV